MSPPLSLLDFPRAVPRALSARQGCLRVAGLEFSCGSFPHPPGWGSCFSAAPWRRWAASLAAACPWPREDVFLYSTRIIIFAYGTARVDNLQGVLPRLHNLAKKAHLMQSRAGRAARERRGGV